MNCGPSLRSCRLLLLPTGQKGLRRNRCGSLATRIAELGRLVSHRAWRGLPARSTCLKALIFHGTSVRRILGRYKLGERWRNHPFQQRFFRTNARQDANTHQNAKQVPGEDCGRL